ncbi:MAG: hypothetical protein JGK28_25030 [Microcoleus sp. PH2017_07_MST_O_A]|nr:hypothetical protein [Microcoleus sp. PH2017_07_MST_O_A]
MLTLDIQSILNSIPNEISWQDIVQFEKLDDRVSIANDLCANIIGVNESTIEWCPNEDSADRLEQLVWWWVVLSVNTFCNLDKNQRSSVVQKNAIALNDKKCDRP